MSYQFETTSSLIDWEKIWIDPLFATQLSQNNESNWPQKKNIISIILNSEKLRQAQFQGMILPLLKSVVKRMNKSEQNSSPAENDEENSNLAETSLLAAETIKMAYELKITIDPKQLELMNVHDSNSAPEDSFRGLVPRTVLNSWLWSENPQIRLAGFALLIETKKTSDVISKQDFESLKIFFKYNLLSQKPAFRQLFLSYFKKVLYNEIFQFYVSTRRTVSFNVSDLYYYSLLEDSRTVKVSPEENGTIKPFKTTRLLSDGCGPF